MKPLEVCPTSGGQFKAGAIHDTWHEGAAVMEGTNYVLRSDVLFSG
jgi:hypothetical protein